MPRDYSWIPKFEKEHKGKHQPNGRELPKDTYTKSPGEIARRLKQHSKDFKDANSRLTFYKNRQGRNLNPTEKNKMHHTEDALRQSYGTQLSPKEKQEKKQNQQKAQSSVRLNAAARLKLLRG